MTRAASSRWLVVAAFAAVYLIWGSTYLAIRIAIETIPPLLMAAVRFLAAGAVLYGWGRLAGGAPPRRAELRTAAVVGFLLIVGGNGMVVYAEQWVPSGLAALLVAVEPLMIVLLLWLVWGERPSVGVLTGTVAGFGGVAMLIAPSDTGGVPWGGAATIVLAALSWAAGSLYAARAPRAPAPLVNLGTSMLAGGGMLLILAGVTGEITELNPAAITMPSVAALGYLIVFGSLVAFSAYVWLVQTTPPGLVSTYAYVNPVVALLLGWGLAGEPLGLRTLMAAAAILGAVALVATRSAGGTSAVTSRNDEPAKASTRRAA
jgi:drug/metabolite transporter (DMT)-like permease